MRTVHLSKITPTDKGHNIALGNGTRTSFANKKDAKKFLADTNRFLTHRLIELNEIYSNAFVQYRQLWFTLSNSRRGTRTSYKEDEKTIKAGLDTVHHFFDRISGAGYGFDDYMVFVDCRKICLFLSEVLKCLVHLNKKRNNTVQYYSLENMLTRCVQISEEISNYSTKLLDNKIPVVETTG